MRHRSSLADNTCNDENSHPPNHRRNREHDQTELQNQVAQLMRVIRVQNLAIVGLSSCFVLVLASTLVLVRHLPHPDDDRTPFWDAGRAGTHRRDWTEEHRIRHRDQVLPHTIIANCSSYGCPLRPVEASQLRGDDRPLVASSHHILMTRKSNRQKPAVVKGVNQDRAVLIPSFCEDHRKVADVDPRGDFFLGIFDGHDDDGHIVAQFASEEIPSRIASRMLNIPHVSSNYTIEEEAMVRIITETFIEVDNDIPVTGGGCTAVAILRRGSSLFMANTGDSTSFVAVYQPPPHFDENLANKNRQYVSSPRSPDSQLHLQGKVSIHHRNKRHKANFPEERLRIESLGGRIHIPPLNPMNSRVVVRSATHSEDVGLAMSRSIGDWEWTAIGVIPDPDVAVLDLTDFLSENEAIGKGARVFVAAGSDGLFDMRKAEFVASHLAYGLFEARRLQEEGRKGKHAYENSDDKESAHFLIRVGQKLVDMASPLKEEWYRDDITFAAQTIEL